MSYFKCPRCHIELTEIGNEIHRLIAENRELRTENWRLTQELANRKPDHQDSHGVCFVATVRGRYFHRPDCDWAQQIPERNLIEFFSHDEAVSNGYQPCRTCRA